MLVMAFSRRLGPLAFRTDADRLCARMRVSDFDYDLPVKLIAQHAPGQRDAARMLVMERSSGKWEDRAFRELPELLRGDELVVLNSAKVIPARLFGRRMGIRAQPAGKDSRVRREFLQSTIEVLLAHQIDTQVWEALVRPGRKIGVGERLIFGEDELRAEVIGRGEYGLRTLRFDGPPDFLSALERLGHTPLPPYIRRSNKSRADEAVDSARYQTVFAKKPGAVAAPTAGLHFTPQILERIRARGIPVVEITLDVGLGTFQPVRTEILEEHRMHCETYDIPAEAAAAIGEGRKEGRCLLAIGTTVVRALEDAAAKSARTRGQPARAEIAPGPASADIFIYPGFKFQMVDALLTNFHLPRTSLLAMVSALAGRENILRAYAHAISQGYRFYSYGDCMLLR